MTRDTAALDAAILAFRAEPNDENRQRVLAAQEAQHNEFLREQSDEFILRTRGDS